MMNIKGAILLLLVTLFSMLSQAQPELKQGDLLFQSLDCGELCDAIEAVTEGWHDKKFSHMGIVESSNNTVYVWESMGPGVRRVLLDNFIKRSNHEITIGRLRNRYQKLIPTAINFIHEKDGVAYDDAFLYDNDKYYCSELIYDAFKSANRDRAFFNLEPMTFKQSGSDAFFPVWIKYYETLHMAIPQGKPGCNPGGISRSKKIKIIGHL